MSYHVMSCHVTSSQVFSRLVISCHVMSCHVMSCHVMSCHVTSCHVMSCHVISRPLTSSHVLSCHVVSCHVASCHVMSCHLTSSHVLSRLVISCHLARESCSRIFLPSLLNSSIMAAGWPRRGFRNRGPVRESGSERRLWRRVHCERARVAPCAFLRPGHRFAWQAAGIGRVASVRVWRRAHFCNLGIVLRGRLRGSGVLEVCREHAAGVPRRCAVRIGFRACFVHAWSTCVLRGRLRGSCVLGACWERAGGPCRRRRAVGIGFGVCCARAHDFTRCDLRFAWQAWDFGCIDALGKALDGGSVWQAQ